MCPAPSSQSYRRELVIPFNILSAPLLRVVIKSVFGMNGLSVHSVVPLPLSPVLHVLMCKLPSFLESLEPEGSVTVSMGIDFCDSTQTASFQLW